MRYEDFNTNPYLSLKEERVYWSLHSRLMEYYVRDAEPMHCKADPGVAREVRIVAASNFEVHLKSWARCPGDRIPLNLEAEVIRLFSRRWGKIRSIRNTCTAPAVIVTLIGFWLACARSAGDGPNLVKPYSYLLVVLGSLFIGAGLLTHFLERRSCGSLISGEAFTPNDPRFADLLFRYGAEFELGPALRDCLLNRGGEPFGIVGSSEVALLKSFAGEWSQSFLELLTVVQALSV